MRLQPFLYCLICLLPGTMDCFAQQDGIPSTGTLYITKSVKFKKGVYTNMPARDSAVIVIEGKNITVDFDGAVLSGSTDVRHPDRFKGVGIVIRNGSNIVIKNAVIRGFKVGMMAKGINNLIIEHCDLSYNFRQHLNSDRKREDLTDWQSYHRNEKDEWLRFGAGIYLRDCDSAIIRSNMVTNGQCGLMLTDCDAGLVYNNNFSFNTGIGIGLYNSSYNKVLHNRVDWNVRGFSYGVYYRGQDSAGILIYEQSSNNVFANNSVTHSGDGFFLWAGQTTMEKGTGGCNDNLVYGNNFSYAPTNGVEITFSRNRIIKNTMIDCWHGIWGGFSYNTVIAGNQFAGNLAGISIEHGQENTITNNSFRGDKVGIELWYTPNRKGEEGYSRSRDTRSRDYRISHNVFTDVKTVFEIRKSMNIQVYNNTMSGYETLQKSDTPIVNRTIADSSLQEDKDSSYIASILPRGNLMNAMLPEEHPKGKQYIMMTEWGPYNFGYPILWLQRSDSMGRMFFDILGKKGRWKIRQLKGVSSPSARAGSVPGKLEVQFRKADIKDIYIELEYTGGSTVSPFGEVSAANVPYRFSYSDFELPVAWKVNWYQFDSTNDPLKHPQAFQQLLRQSAVKTVDTSELHYAWWSGLGKGYPGGNLATVASASIDAPRGRYRIGLSAGEMGRVYIDDKLVIDAWDPSKKTADADYHNDADVTLNGKHRIRVEHAQYGGYGMLVLKIKKAD